MQQQHRIQQEMAQRQMAQQQEQMRANGMLQQGGNIHINEKKDIVGIIQEESKSILVIIAFSILMNLDQVNSLFKNISLFATESGELNLQCVFVKALLIGISYLVIKTYLL